MPLSATKGGLGTKADLDLVATIANTRLLTQSMLRTADLRGTTAPGTMNGAFSFSDETDPATPRWAWLDELNRIWACLWNVAIPQTPTVGQASGYNGWDVADDGVSSGSPDLSKGLATARVNAYWDPGGTWPGNPGADSGYGGNKIVGSPGPNFWMEAPGFTNVKCFRYARAIFTSKQDPFAIVSGIMTEELTHAIGAGSHYTSGTPHVDTMSFSGLPAFTYGFYGRYEVKFSRPAGMGYADPGISEYNLAGGTSGGGAVLASFGHLLDGDDFYMWLDDINPRDESKILVSLGAYADGNQTFESYVSTTGWVFVHSKFAGGLFSAYNDSTSGSVAGDNVIHPRNETVRIELHDFLSNSPLLSTSDVLDFPTLESQLSSPGSGVRDVDTKIRSMLRSDTRALLDADFVDAPPGTNSTALDFLVDDFNNLVIGYPGSIYSLPEWEGVTLRPGTRWFVELDPLDSEMRRRMNRLLLEDAYPDGITTGIRRIPTSEVSPDEEILDLTLPDTEGGVGYNGIPLVMAQISTVSTAKVIYLADALPQWGYHTVLDYDLPHIWSGYGNPPSGPRGQILDTIGNPTWEPACNPTPANWPVFHVNDFGQLQSESSSLPRPDLQTVGYAPFWNCDPYHSWSVRSPQNILAGTTEFLFFGIFIASGSVEAGKRIEWSCHNRNVTAYISIPSLGDYPDPTDPTTYHHATTTGYFTWPDDFASPIDYEGYFITIAVKNDTADTQTIHEVTSSFLPLDGESPPLPDPNFFPTTEPNNGQSGFDTGTSLGITFGESYIFGPIDNNGRIYPNFNLPVPQRGYMIRSITIRRKQVENSAGLMVDETATDSPACFVDVGIMAGAGVIAGAINGSYPGDFITFDTITMGTGVNEVTQSAMYPVLDGAPLAYQVTPVVGDATLYMDIYASVEFQPAINNTFVCDDPTSYPVTGSFNGYPYLSNTWGWMLNQNSPDSTSIMHVSQQGSKHRTGANDVMPPISAKAISDLYTFLQTIPTLP